MPDGLAIHLDPLGGIAGDMFVAAMLDAWPLLEVGTMEAIRTVIGPDVAGLGVTSAQSASIAGKRFVLESSGDHDSDVGHHHHHHFCDIREMLATSKLERPVRERAIDIFTILAEAEAVVHGVDIGEVAFHEVGAIDSLADIVGAAYLIDAVSAQSWSVASLPIGSGTVVSSHGLLPVPAPATARLLAGFDVFDDGHPGERVTPTGAAILRHLSPRQDSTARCGRLTAIGHGLGTRIIQGVPNLLRVLAFAAPEHPDRDYVDVIEFDVDDQSSEDLAIGLENLRANPFVLEVYQQAAFGKKGRLAVHVRVIARAGSADDIAAQCFSETTTLGLRVMRQMRYVLRRESATVNTSEGPIRVKRAWRPGGALTCKVEADDLVRVEGGHAARQRVSERAAGDPAAGDPKDREA